MELDPIDFLPGYDPSCFVCSRRRAILTQAFTFILMVALFVAGYYLYYQSDYIECEFLKDNNKYVTKKDAELTQRINLLKQEIDKLDELFTKIYLQQDTVIKKKIENALEVYDADNIGLYDYASVYAYGSIVSIGSTEPYPVNKMITFFKLINFDLLSDPESILQPNNLPGNCFAFYGNNGQIRIKLGRKIRIHAVTLDHIKIMDDASSAPKDFEVFGLNDPEEDLGVVLGQFTYDIGGRPYQTFRTNTNVTFFLFEYVELRILNNYGKKEFTCVYRFRVHDRINMK